MKKTIRKLSLCRETLRALESPDLYRVRAEGGPQTVLPSCQTNCDITWTCTDLPQIC